MTRTLMRNRHLAQFIVHCSFVIVEWRVSGNDK
jgi:hypothetical protein